MTCTKTTTLQINLTLVELQIGYVLNHSKAQDCFVGIIDNWRNFTQTCLLLGSLHFCSWCPITSKCWASVGIEMMMSNSAVCTGLAFAVWIRMVFVMVHDLAPVELVYHDECCVSINANIIYKKYLQMHCEKKNCVWFQHHKVLWWVSNPTDNKSLSNGSGHGLLPNWQQAITWTNNNLLQRH